LLGRINLHGVGVELSWIGDLLSNWKASCSALTANSVYFDSMTQEILISDVLIIMMLIPSRARAPNMIEAIPE
jgi:hypothetical protein